MYLYRITRDEYLNDFSGLWGSYKDGGRWNLPGFPVLYFGSSPGVALLEMANYLPNPRNVPKDYRMGIYSLPDEIKVESISRDNLSDNWNDFPYPKFTQEMGSKWLKERSSLCLIVPSAAVCNGMESCIVVNPLHPELCHLKLMDKKEKLYNDRAFNGLS